MNGEGARVLVLGAGMVARPLVRHLLERGHRVVVADLLEARAERMVAGYESGSAVQLNLRDGEALDARIADCDLAVSLLPFAFHPEVARRCIAHRKDMVTTSYVSDEMVALDGDARAAGVTLLNEIGLDPGIDHMTAMHVIDDVRARGGRIRSFRSYCGGLPAPEANTNPFGYKFSWAPRGVLLASRNGARYLKEGREITVPPERLFRDMHLVAVPGAGDFEAYPNRDSIAYIDIYGLEGISTMLRGTLRNLGWCDTMFSLRALGMLELDELGVGRMTYADFMRQHILGGDVREGEELRVAAARKLGIPADALPVWNMHWLGLLSEQRRFGIHRISPLDALGTLMLEKLAYGEGERDMIVLLHDFEAELPGEKRERIVSTLLQFGEAVGDTAMSRAVSLPAAVAADLILDGRLETTGVLRPIAREIYEPVLAALDALGIGCAVATESF